jgi:nitroreductase
MPPILEVIKKRRAYRALQKIEITDELIENLGKAIQLSPSCYNNQPWQFIFTYNPSILEKLHGALSKGNIWATQASLIITVCAKKQDDCIINEREYYLFDTGIATAFLILQATNLNLIAHPIAGYSPKKVKEILDIPENYMVISLVIIGKHSEIIPPFLSKKQIEAERKRPLRKPLKSFIHHNMFINGDK